MKILVVGSQKDWAFENHYVKHFKDLGLDVSCYNAHDMFYDYYYESLFNKIIFRVGLSGVYKSINKNLIEKVKRGHYDIVWVFKGMELFPETLKTLKELGCKLVNFNPDHPFVYNFKGSGNINVLNSIPFFDLHLCYNLAVKEKMEKDYGITCKWLPFGFEKNDIIVPKEEDEILKACFIGTPDDYRATQLKAIATSGIPLDVYGEGWEKFIDVKPFNNLKVYPAIYKSDFNKIATKYRVQLNLFRPHNDNSHNMRTFEMPGLACIMIAPNSKEHELLFEADKEVFYYNGLEEMLSKIETILNFDYNKALAIRMAAYQKALTEGYSYYDRTKKVIGYFEALLAHE